VTRLQPLWDIELAEEPVSWSLIGLGLQGSLDLAISPFSLPGDCMQDGTNSPPLCVKMERAASENLARSNSASSARAGLVEGANRLGGALPLLAKGHTACVPQLRHSSTSAVPVVKGRDFLGSCQGCSQNLFSKGIRGISRLLWEFTDC
jgi:hypothetical protein